MPSCSGFAKSWRRRISTSSLAIEWLGSVDYAKALTLQEEAVAARRAGSGRDRLLLLTHPAVITLGRGSKPENLLTPRAELTRRGIAVHEVARGGDVTFHGPGQLVGYPVLDLKRRGTPDVFAFLRALESCLIEALAAVGVRAKRWEGRTGVFVADTDPARKIASIGIGVKRWITYHGFALNITVDPDAFRDIVPCGLHDVAMTSVAEELGVAPDEELFLAVRREVEMSFARAFRV